MTKFKLIILLFLNLKAGQGPSIETSDIPSGPTPPAMGNPYIDFLFKKPDNSTKETEPNNYYKPMNIDDIIKSNNIFNRHPSSF